MSLKNKISFLFSLLFLVSSLCFGKNIDVTAQQVFANIEWATKNGVVLEKIENVGFVDKAGTQKTGFLEIIKQEDGKLGVRINDYGKIIYPTAKVNGIPVVRILTGNNGKIAIIGRKMPYVEKVAGDFEKLGKEVEIFDKYKAFGGKGYNNLKEIEDDFNLIKSQYPNGIIPYDKLKSTLWYKENERWAKWIKEQGYDVYDLGDNPGQFINSFDRQNVPVASAFYDLEKIEIFNSK